MPLYKWDHVVEDVKPHGENWYTDVTNAVIKEVVSVDKNLFMAMKLAFDERDKLLKA